MAEAFSSVQVGMWRPPQLALQLLQLLQQLLLSKAAEVFDITEFAMCNRFQGWYGDSRIGM